MEECTWSYKLVSDNHNHIYSHTNLYDKVWRDYFVAVNLPGFLAVPVPG